MKFCVNNLNVSIKLTSVEHYRINKLFSEKKSFSQYMFVLLQNFSSIEKSIFYCSPRSDRNLLFLFLCFCRLIWFEKRNQLKTQHIKHGTINTELKFSLITIKWSLKRKKQKRQNGRRMFEVEASCNSQQLSSKYLLFFKN